MRPRLCVSSVSESLICPIIRPSISITHPKRLALRRSKSCLPSLSASHFGSDRNPAMRAACEDGTYRLNSLRSCNFGRLRTSASLAGDDNSLLPRHRIHGSELACSRQLRPRVSLSVCPPIPTSVHTPMNPVLDPCIPSSSGSWIDVRRANIVSLI